MKRLLLFAVARVSIACGSTALPTAPSGTAVSEVFAGTLSVGGSASYDFSVATSGGLLSITLTAAGPPATIYTGVGIGNRTDSTCTALSNGTAVSPAGTTPQLSGTASAGSYCVFVYDAGNQTADIITQSPSRTSSFPIQALVFLAGSSFVPFVVPTPPRSSGPRRSTKITKRDRDKRTKDGEATVRRVA